MSSHCIAPGCLEPRAAGAVFCEACMLAPAGKRGGWISAYKRRQRAGGDVPIDAHNIVRRLWIGSRPPVDRPLPMFDVVVLCAKEYQPEMPHVPVVLRVPLDDAQLDAVQFRAALLGARELAAYLQAGKTALVTCWAGRNRSALVAGLALRLLAPRSSADRIIATIRARRHPSALSNVHFVSYLRMFGRR